MIGEIGSFKMKKLLLILLCLPMIGLGQCITGNCKNGQGTYNYPNSGNKYVGQWKDYKRDGQGTFTWANGDKYVGEFKDGNLHGQGTLNYASGENYVGELKYGNLQQQMVHKQTRKHGAHTNVHPKRWLFKTGWAGGASWMRGLAWMAGWQGWLGCLRLGCLAWMAGRKAGWDA